MKKFFSSRRTNTVESEEVSLSALELLVKDSPFKKTLLERAEMTISCKDADYIPKVKNAGTFSRVDNVDTQIMHNGLIVQRGGYYGEWMEHIIKELKGHHEPQEEKIFYEILKRLDSKASMIELGSFWSYYSLWFNKEIKNATNICCEPDPNNIKIGKINARLNKAPLVFIDAAAGEGRGKFVDFNLESTPGEIRKVPILSVDEIMQTKRLKKLDLLHMDVQGQELAAINGSLETIMTKKLRFLIVSTHHFSISGDPLTHFKCLEIIKSHGGHIIADHTVLESFSGDGLIAASFSGLDRDLKVEISINSSSNSLYRPYEEDLAVIIENYEQLRQKKKILS